MPPPTIAHYNGTLQWHHVHSPKVGRHPPQLQWHPAMAPCNGTTSTPVKLVVNPPQLQWHPAAAPRPLPQSWPSPSPSLLAHYNGTLQSPKLVVTLPNHSTLNGTLRWHQQMAPRPLHPAMAPWCHVQSAKVVHRPHPLIGSKNPYSFRYLGNNGTLQWHPGALSTPAKLAHHRLPPQHTTMAPCNSTSATSNLPKPSPP